MGRPQGYAIPRAVFLGVALPAALLTVVVFSVGAASAVPSVQYFRLEPGTPTESELAFVVPIFVIGDPAGAPANLSQTRQAWQDLQVDYLNDSPAPLANWSVPDWGPGRFDLSFSLTMIQAALIESGQALLALNSSIVWNGTVYGAAGVIDGAVLAGSVQPGEWWSTIFGIPSPPPSSNPQSLSDVIDDLAWFGESTAGRALYMGVTLIAVAIYLWEGHKLARSRLLGPHSGSSQRKGSS